MLRELLLAPIAAMVVLSLMLAITDVAESTSQKTLDYAVDMDAAMECAMKALPITKCSPNLLNGTNFTKEATQYKELNQEYIEELKTLIIEMENELNATNTSNSTIYN